MLLGISGLAASGKDTSADFLVKEFNFVKISFADPIKRIARDVFDFSEAQLWGPSQFRNEPDPRFPKEDGTFLTPREVLQELGSVLRKCYPNVWIDYALRLSDTILDNPTKFTYSNKLGLYPQDCSQNPIQGVAIADVRYRNEIEILRKRGAKIIRVKRAAAGLSGKAALHSSEVEQQSILDEEFDLVVDNNDSFDHLYNQLKDFYVQ